jgi:hypothetical protein
MSKDRLCINAMEGQQRQRQRQHEPHDVGVALLVSTVAAKSFVRCSGSDGNTVLRAFREASGPIHRSMLSWLEDR